MTASRPLALARSLTQQLQTTCLVLASGLQALPSQLQQEALARPLLGRLERVRGSLDDVMDYMVNNTPLNWLVGPFYPHVVAVETPAASPRARPLTPPPPEACEEAERPQEDSGSALVPPPCQEQQQQQ